MSSPKKITNVLKANTWYQGVFTIILTVICITAVVYSFVVSHQKDAIQAAQVTLEQYRADLVALALYDNIESIRLFVESLNQQHNNVSYRFVKKDEKSEQGEDEYAYVLSIGIDNLGTIFYTVHTGKVVNFYALSIAAISIAMLFMGSFLIYRKAHKTIIEQVVIPLSTLNEIISKANDIKEILALGSVNSNVHEIKAILDVLLEATKRINKNEKELAESRELVSVARATQMLAHDIKRPFSMVKTILDLLKESTGKDDFNDLCERYIPEIEKTLVTISGLVSDVVEIGQDVEFSGKPESLVEIIFESLKSISSAIGKKYFYIEYKLLHKNFISADKVKCIRIFENILINAVECVNENGGIWIKTKNLKIKDNFFIEICIGNSGSFIEEEYREIVFDIFYTKGKKSGTGLGLAIVKRFVALHGGCVACRSSKEYGTEFIFTLPCVSLEDVSKSINMPKSSAELKAIYGMNFLSFDFQGKCIKNLEYRIIKKLEKANELIHVLIADDELLYAEAISNYVNGLNNLTACISVSVVASGEEVLLAAAMKKIHLMIIDIDFGKGRMNGFEVAKSLRKKGYKMIICLHSNHGALNYSQIAMESGANVFLPKPLNKNHLLKLIDALIKIYQSNHFVAGQKVTIC